MSEERKAFEQFINDLSEMNLERNWRLIAPRLIQLGDAYIATLPWHKRLRFRISSRMRRIWTWFDFWYVIPTQALIRVLFKRGQP